MATKAFNRIMAGLREVRDILRGRIIPHKIHYPPQNVLTLTKAKKDEE